jgi:hypothetical protein
MLSWKFSAAISAVVMISMVGFCVAIVLALFPYIVSTIPPASFLETNLHNGRQLTQQGINTGAVSSLDGKSIIYQSHNADNGEYCDQIYYMPDIDKPEETHQLTTGGLAIQPYFIHVRLDSMMLYLLVCSVVDDFVFFLSLDRVQMTLYMLLPVFGVTFVRWEPKVVSFPDYPLPL